MKIIADNLLVLHIDILDLELHPLKLSKDLRQYRISIGIAVRRHLRCSEYAFTSTKNCRNFVSGYATIVIPLGIDKDTRMDKTICTWIPGNATLVVKPRNSGQNI